MSIKTKYIGLSLSSNRTRTNFLMTSCIHLKSAIHLNRVSLVFVLGSKPQNVTSLPCKVDLMNNSCIVKRMLNKFNSSV